MECGLGERDNFLAKLRLYLGKYVSRRLESPSSCNSGSFVLEEGSSRFISSNDNVALAEHE